jgi:hypothetical protein
VGEDRREGWWFSDGYGDYIRHFVVAMGAVPEWAPPRENHLLRSTSVVTRVEYAPSRVAWTTFDADATETLRLSARPATVTSAGQALSERETLDDAGYEVRPLASGDVVVRVRHRRPGEVVALLNASAPPVEPTLVPIPAAAAPSSGCSSAAVPPAATAGALAVVAGLAMVGARRAGARRRSHRRGKQGRR